MYGVVISLVFLLVVGLVWLVFVEVTGHGGELLGFGFVFSIWENT